VDLGAKLGGHGRTLTYLIAMTADGFIAGPGGEIDVYPTPEEYLGHLCTEFPETLPTHVRAHLGIADAHLRRLVVSSTLPADDPAAGRRAVRESDEVVVKQYPIMLGTGVPMFAGEFAPLSLRRTGIATFDSGRVILRYTRA
jgi:hypothetical protein